MVTIRYKPLNIAKLKVHISQDIQIINDPDAAADLLGISARMLRKRFRQEEHDRLWMFILKEKIEHFLENLHPYPTEENRQFSNAEKVIDLYRFSLPSPDCTWLRDVQEVIALINDNPFDFNLNINWIKNKLSITDKMYTQKFYYFTRMRVTEYVRWHRLIIAKYLLSHSSLKVGDIGLLIGYNSLSAFSKAFAQDVGSSPKAYLAAHPVHSSQSSTQSDLVEETQAVIEEGESLRRKASG